MFLIAAAVRRHHTIIVLGVLKIPLSSYSVSSRRCFLGESEVSFHHLPRIAVDPCGLTIASVGLEPRFPASAAIPAPLRSLRIGALSYNIHAQTHPSLDAF